MEIQNSIKWRIQISDHPPRSILCCGLLLLVAVMFVYWLFWINSVKSKFFVICVHWTVCSISKWWANHRSEISLNALNPHFPVCWGLCVQRAFRFRHAVYNVAFAFCSSTCKASRSGSDEKNNVPSATPASVRLLLTRLPWLKAFCFQNHFRKGWEHVKIQQSSLFLLRFSYISQVDVPWIFFKPLILSSLWFIFRVLKNLIWTILPASMFSGGLSLQRLGAGPGFAAIDWGWWER